MTISYRFKISRYIERPGLDRRARHLCWISSLVATGDESNLRQAIIMGVRDDVSLRMIREAILQSYLFVGYPRVINSLFLLKGLCAELDLDYPSETGSIEDYPDWGKWESRGEDLCRRVYGHSYENLQDRIVSLHPLVARWMIVEGYGKVLSRDGLSPELREMLVVSVLASQGVWRQLRSHLKGGLNLGVSATELREAISQLSPFLPADQVEYALKLFEDQIDREKRNR